MKIIDPNKEYSVASLAYMAGIIDGEGSITITDCSKSQGKVFFSTQLSISSTDKVLIDWIINIFGGNHREYTSKQHPVNSRKLVHSWQVTGKNLETILHLTRPYIVIKQLEIEIMLKMRATFHTVPGGSKLPEETIKLRRKYTKQLHNIHCRGNYKK